MSLVVDVEIESTDMAVRQCMQALIDCSTMGCVIDIEWARLNNIPMHPLTKPIPVYNVDGTANDAGMITDITTSSYDMRTTRSTHSWQSLILGSRV
jgi:hypothetical protein